MGETFNTNLHKAKSRARRALFELLAEWQTQISEDGPVRYADFAKKGDAFLNAVSDFVAEHHDDIQRRTEREVRDSVEPRPRRSLICVEHHALMPHFGCKESAERVAAGGGDASHFTTPHVTHPFVQHENEQFAEAFGGGCAHVEDDILCGFPREAHVIDHAFRSMNGEDKCAAIVGQLPDKIGCGRPASEHQNRHYGAPDPRPMPNGTERPGEHWNARLIREAAEQHKSDSGVPICGDSQHRHNGPCEVYAHRPDET